MPPLVLVPGIQGHWEYMRPAVEALAESFRVLTFSLLGERKSARSFDPALGLDNDAAEIARLLDDRQIDRAVVVGLSFGGLAAIRFAATRPDRARALVLASVPGPGWRLKKRHQIYARLPWLFGPLFLAETPWRVRAEVAAALPARRGRLRFGAAQLRTFATAGLSLSRMADRGRMIHYLNPAADCCRIVAPTLVITGERHLDRVVPVDGTREYLTLVRGARAATLERTGHLGPITRPHAFAALVNDFVASCSRDDHAAA